jgi:anti-sigma B factor antagonist
MQIVIDDAAGATARVALMGKLDIQGAEVIALPLATLSGGKKNIIIDMSGVSFIASIGIRHLVSAAKALARRGGTLILISPTDVVAGILTTAGINSIIPTVGSESEARALVGGT